MDPQSEETDSNSSKTDLCSQSDVTENFNELLLQNNEQKSKLAFLAKTVEQKDDLIKLLMKEKNILESEKVLLQKERDTSIREKESIVMRFAMVEKNLLDVRNQLDQAEKREKKQQKECDSLNDKIRAAKEEKTRISAALDAKSQEYRNALRDVERLKNELSCLETKCKWNSVKLKQESEYNTALEKELNELKNIETTQTNEFSESAEKIAELKATQIMLKHVNTEQMQRISAFEQQVEGISKELLTTKSLLAVSNKQLTDVSAENNKFHQENLDLQNLVDSNVLKIAELQAKLNELEALRAQLSIEKDANQNHTVNIESLKKQLTDHTTSIDKLHQRESELLALNQELSTVNATLQNELSLHKSKSLAMSLENDLVKKNHIEYEANLAKLRDELNTESKARIEQRLLMARHVAEKSKECECLQKKLDQALGDLDAVKKKNSLIIKDLQREIAALQKAASKEVSQTANDFNSHEQANTDVQSRHEDEYKEKEPSTSKLIERIIRLQHANNRQSEKIEFLENHSSTLVAELQKKTKIVQHYMVKEQASSVPAGDKNKLYNGIMNAVYGNVKTSEMSIELVLEVNKKLQCVLEDTLLKNITLKDNLDTLGLEVDRLTRQATIYKRDTR